MNHFRIVSVLLVLALSTAALWAQSNEGRIIGTIRDTSGGVVVGARVSIINTETNIVRSLVSNGAGDYAAPALEPGSYKVSAEATGFKTTQSEAFRVEVSRDVRIDLKLTPGTVSETIVVKEDATLTDTTDTTLNGVLGNKAINELPLNGRDFQNLLPLHPGVQRTPGGGFHSVTSNGNRPDDNNFYIDGADDNDVYYGETVVNDAGIQGTPASILPLDAIQEFNTQESPEADYGVKPGVVVNLGLKSGTNDIHGTAYYFTRNAAVDARNFYLGGNSSWPLWTTPSQTENISDTASRTGGRHSLKFGGEFRYGDVQYYRATEGRGRVDFHTLEDFVAGDPRDWELLYGNPARNVNLKSFGLFVQDSYRISPRITINMGLRYDLTYPIEDSHNQLANYVPSAGIVQVGKGIGSPYPTNYNNVSPRLGVAWDVFGSGRTVVRAGGGIIFEQPSIRTFMFSGGGLNLNPSGVPGVSPGNGTITSFLVDSRDTSVINWNTTGPAIFPGRGAEFVQHRLSLQYFFYEPAFGNALCSQLELERSASDRVKLHAAGCVCGKPRDRSLQHHGHQSAQSRAVYSLHFCHGRRL